LLPCKNITIPRGIWLASVIIIQSKSSILTSYANFRITCFVMAVSFT
jgi:hypothetical protein